MFHKIKTVRFKLTAIFLISVLVPLLILLLVLSVYYMKRTEESTLVSARSTVASLGKNVEIYLNDLENITLIPYMNDNVMKALQNKQKIAGEEASDEELYEINRALLYELPIYFQLMRQDVSDLLILPQDGSAYLMSENSSHYRKEYDYWGQNWYQEAVEADGSAVFIGNHEQDYLFTSKPGGVFSVARQIKDIETREVLGVILADTKTSVLESMLDYIPFDDGAYCFILDGKGKLVCANQEVPEPLSERMENSTDKEGFRDYLVASSQVEGTQWQVVLLLPRNDLQKQKRLVFITAAAAAVLYLLAGSILFSFVSRRVTKPLSRLSETMKEVQEGNFQADYQVETQDEIGELGNNFNAMVRQINELIEREYKAVLAGKDMEYYALQSQIQPHFIYNVLNNLIGLNRAGEKETLEKTVLSLTEILRYTLSHGDMVKICVELDVIEKYCELQKLRFGPRLEYVITCEEEYASCSIPKLLLQPLVENAILHGIEPREEGGLVTLMGEEIQEKDEDYLLFTVTDNGVGFCPEELGAEKCVGLQNIRKRLGLVYREASFSIESSPGKGTVVQIRIPRKEVKNEGIDCGR